VTVRLFAAIALAVAIGLAFGLSPYASSSPDGLERVAEDKGFLEDGRGRDAPIPDYAVPGVDDDRLATGLAGFAGTLAVFALGTGVAVVVRRRRRISPCA
jgi:PDGLE domain